MSSYWLAAKRLSQLDIAENAPGFPRLGTTFCSKGLGWTEKQHSAARQRNGGVIDSWMPRGIKMYMMQR